jgi:GT2 family glycosyltransferase
VNFHVLHKANLSWALETGTMLSNTDLVLYLDSDCTFKTGTIKAFLDAARNGSPSKEVYKGEVVFAPGKTYLENLISLSRSHHTAEILTAYKPPLMVSKSIRDKIGGYMFDNRLIWREDSDLDNRVRTANIKIVSVPKGSIFHGTIGLKTDLRSTYRYGVGLAIAEALKIKLTEVPRSVISTFKSKGCMPALYMLFRNRVYGAGYLFKKINIISGRYLLKNKPNMQT